MSENTFTVTSWNEHIVSGEQDQPRFAYAHTACSYSGTIEGRSVCDYLLYYPGEGYDGRGHTSPGMERVEGSVAGRKGSFVIRHDVGYGPDGVHGTWQVVPGSGTGELATLAGKGTIAGRSEPMSYTFDYAI